MTTVYIIYSTSADRYYVGFSKQIRKRLKSHRSGRTRSTSSSQDWELVWSDEVENSFHARVLEKKIKSRGAAQFIQDQ